jgi:hypothetical protein
MKSVAARKVTTPEDRALALAVIASVYLREKQWIRNPGAEIPAEPRSGARRLVVQSRGSWSRARVPPSGEVSSVTEPL